jgi:hypothetical protein
MVMTNRERIKAALLGKPCEFVYSNKLSSLNRSFVARGFQVQILGMKSAVHF